MGNRVVFTILILKKAARRLVNFYDFIDVWVLGKSIIQIGGKMKKRILAAGLGIGLAVAGAGFLTACGPEATPIPDGISIYANFDTTYYVGEELNVSGGILNYTKDGKTTQVAITSDMISGFSSTSVGSRTLVITYEGETLVVNYEVIPEVPFSFDRVYKADVVEGTDDETDYLYIRFEKKNDEVYFKLAELDQNTLLYIDASYNSQIWEEASEGIYPVLPAKKLNCHFNSNTKKWEFEKVITRDGGTTAYTFTDVTASQFNFKIQESENINAVVDNLPYLLDVTMKLQPNPMPTPDGISIHTNFDTTYYVGEELDVTGGILNYTKDGKTTQVSITDNMITGFSNETAGTRSLVITYQGETLVVNYVVKDTPEIPFSFEKVYKSDSSLDEVYPQDAYIRFEKKGDEVYFIMRIKSQDAQVDASYNSQIWKEVGDATNPALPARKLNCHFNTKTEKWEIEKVRIKEGETGTEGLTGVLDFTFTNVSKDQFSLKLQVAESENADFDYEYDITMKLLN